MSRWQAFGVVLVAVGAVGAIALVWSAVGPRCTIQPTGCDAVSPVEWVAAGAIALCAIGFAAAILSRPE